MEERALRFVHQIQQACPPEKTEIKYLKSKLNSCADYLSRNPLVSDHVFLSESDRLAFLARSKAIGTIFVEETSEAWIRHCQIQKESFVNSSVGSSVNSNFSSFVNSEAQEGYVNIMYKFIRQHDQQTAQGVHVNTKRVRLTPEQLVDFHSFYGHCGAERLYDLLQGLNNLFVVPSREACRNLLRNCPHCAKLRPLVNANKSNPLPVPIRPRMTIAIDHWEPHGKLRDRFNYQSVFEVKDLHSKFVTLFPCVTKSHKEVISHLSLYLQLNPGITKCVADNAFKGVLIDQFFDENGITKIHSPAYRPSSNGQIERVNRELNKLILQLEDDLKVPVNEWSRVIPLAAQIINSTPHSITRLPPAILHFGCHTNKFLPDSDGTGASQSQHDMWSLAFKRMEKARKLKSTNPQPQNYPKVDLEPGQKVWVNLNGNFIRAEIIKDHGDVCIIQKMDVVGNSRYAIIGVHKSRISLRI